MDVLKGVDYPNLLHGSTVNGGEERKIGSQCQSSEELEQGD